MSPPSGRRDSSSAGFGEGMMELKYSGVRDFPWKEPGALSRVLESGQCGGLCLQGGPGVEN